MQRTIKSFPEYSFLKTFAEVEKSKRSFHFFNTHIILNISWYTCFIISFYHIINCISKIIFHYCYCPEFRE